MPGEFGLPVFRLIRNNGFSAFRTSLCFIASANEFYLEIERNVRRRFASATIADLQLSYFSRDVVTTTCAESFFWLCSASGCNRKVLGSRVAEEAMAVDPEDWRGAKDSYSISTRLPKWIPSMNSSP